MACSGVIDARAPAFSPPYSSASGYVQEFWPDSQTVRHEPAGRGDRFMRAMATAIRTIGHEDRLSLVDHLEELRTRLIVSAIALAVAFGVCLWQNHALLEIINRRWTSRPRTGREGQRAARADRACPAGRARRSRATRSRSRARWPIPPAGSARDPRAAGRRDPAAAGRRREDPARPAGQQAGDARGRRAVHDDAQGRALFALVLSLPLILFELYGFVLPAFSPNERRIALPLLAASRSCSRPGCVRLLRGAARGGALLPELQQQPVQRARAGEPVLQIRRNDAARDGSRVPGAGRDPRRHARRDRDPEQLRHNRRYAILACAAVAAFLPETRSRCCSRPCRCICCTRRVSCSRRLSSAATRKREGQTPGAGEAPDGGSPAEKRTEPSVQQIIDHFDPELS